jgi:N-acetylglutamate synthase/N-acetylornithine aminotransferase
MDEIDKLSAGALAGSDAERGRVVINIGDEPAQRAITRLARWLKWRRWLADEGAGFIPQRNRVPARKR